MFRIGPGSLAVVFLLSVFSPAQSSDKKKHHGKPLNAVDLFKRAAPGIVLIGCLDQKGAVASYGTGFLVSADGKIATNFHVIEACKGVSVKFANGDIYDGATVVDTDLRKDLALIRVKAVNTPELPLGDSDDLEVGQRVYSIGNPSGLQNTLQEGLVNGFRQVTGYKLVQVSTSLNPGNSGGPILDDEGDVVAIASRIVQGADNLGFAIPVNYLKGYLQTKTEVPFGTFAAGMAPILAKLQVVQDISGNWSGNLAANPHPLRVVVHIRKGAAGLEGTLDSPDQNVTGMKITSILFSQSTLSFRVDSVKGEYTGKVNAQGNQIEGTWSQGSPQPLTLERTGPPEAGTVQETEGRTAAPPPPAGSAAMPVGTDKLEQFLRSKIGNWTADDAKATLGAVVKEGPFNWANKEHDGVGVYLLFHSPGTAFRSVNLRFSGTTQRLINIAFEPLQPVQWASQLAYMKQKFPGEEFRVQGRPELPEYVFQQSRTIFSVRPDGTVATMFAY